MNKTIETVTLLPGQNKHGKAEAFDQITINKGYAIAIVGATGSGKSQLLYDIERLAQHDTKSRRTVLINNTIPDKAIRFDPKKKLIASLAQSMNFLTDNTVGDFLQLHLEARGKKQNPALIKTVIEKANSITGEAITADMNLLNLSGGQSRALMIADVAYISDSPIILIDELENAGIKKKHAIETLLEEDKIILIVTHDPCLALQADKRIIIENGGITQVLQTTPQEKKIAHYLSCIEQDFFAIREKIRSGKQIQHVAITCVPPEMEGNQ